MPEGWWIWKLRKRGIIARETARTALLDPEFRVQILDRLQEIADEDDEYTAPALELIDRIRVL